MLALLPMLLAAPPDRVLVPAGTWRPLMPPDPTETEVRIESFYMAISPVTNAMYAAFLAKNPTWQRDQVARLFAESGYLQSWEGSAFPGRNVPADAPVTEISWYAARAYCEAQGGRLPLEAEWEWAASDPALSANAIAWYSQPTPARLPAIGGPPNQHGLRDLQVVWEWVEDFNSTLVSTDIRDAGAKYCGGGAANAQDVEDYASFMRLAFRSALNADTTVRNLGFRCAWDHQP